MNRLVSKKLNAVRRAGRVRSRITGTAKRPRLSVHISNLHVTAQLIDDTTGKSLVYVTTAGQKLEGNLSVKAAKAGTDIATKAKKAGIKQVVFDRGAHLYHGRIKALADAARAGGLEF